MSAPVHEPVQFLRGTLAAWEADAASGTPTVPLAGQQVVGFAPDGSVDVRMGTGTATWPTLPRVGANTFALASRLDRAGVDAIDRGATANGTTDVTAILQGLLDTYDTVLLPPGTYGISAMLRVKSHQRLIGMDRYRTIIKALPTMPNKVTLIGSSNTRTDGVTHTNYVEDVILKNFRVDGTGHDRPYTEPNDTHGSCIRLSTVRDVLIEGVTAVNGYLHCIDICASQYEPSWPAGSDGDVNYVVPGPSQRVIIRDCYAADSVRDDPITCHDSSDILIDSCVVERTRPLNSGDQHGIEVDEGCYRVSVIDCMVSDHNVGFQVKGHTNTTPSRDVTLTRCRAFRCRASFHLYHDNPATIPVGKVSWAKNISLLDCESIDPAPKADVVPDDLITCSVKIAGYRNVEIRNLVCRGGTGEYANNIVLDFGCDDILIDGVWAINVCQGSTGVGRGFITTASAYGQGSNRVRVHNVTIDPTGTALAIPVFRATNIATVVDIDGMTGKGSTGPMIWLGEVKPNDRALRLIKNGFTNLITVGAGLFAAGTGGGPTHDRELPYGSGISIWKKRLPSNYTSIFHATDLADVTGATIDVPVVGPEDAFDVEIKFDVRHNTVAPVSATESLTCKFIGVLSVDGTDRTESQAIFGVPGVQWARGMPSQSYPTSGLAAGNRTFKLRARHTITGHAFTAAGGHTTLTVKKTNASGWGATVES